MPPEHDTALVEAWLSAAASQVTAAALEGIYADVAEAVAARGPACWASGRCCNFQRAGHRLYVTGLEAAYLLTRLPRHPQAADEPGRVRLPVLPAGSPADHGADQTDLPARLADAVERGCCPFQSANLCGVHALRPLGCRVYFCDRSAQTWQQDLYERTLAALRELHDAHGVPYQYAEWRALLGLFTAAARQGRAADHGQ